MLRAVARSLMVMSHMEALVSLQDVQLILLDLASNCGKRSGWDCCSDPITADWRDSALESKCCGQQDDIICGATLETFRALYAWSR